MCLSVRVLLTSLANIQAWAGQFLSCTYNMHAPCINRRIYQAEYGCYIKQFCLYKLFTVVIKYSTSNEKKLHIVDSGKK